MTVFVHPFDKNIEQNQSFCHLPLSHNFFYQHSKNWLGSVLGTLPKSQITKCLLMNNRIAMSNQITKYQFLQTTIWITKVFDHKIIVSTFFVKLYDINSMKTESMITHVSKHHLFPRYLSQKFGYLLSSVFLTNNKK